MTNNTFRFFDGNEIERAKVDTTVWVTWLEEMNKEIGDQKEDYVSGYPVYRVVWFDQDGDEWTNYFDVISTRELARMIAFVESVGVDNVEKIEVVLIKVTVEP